MSRTENAFKNTTYGIISKIVSLVLGFVSRTVFIYILGNQYLGVNGLYTEILSMLSLAELGFGTALNFAMYKPVAENDSEKILKLLDFYKKIYRIIALIVAIIGIALLPFLQYIVKGADQLSLFDLRLYFLIFLFNSIIGYFVSYKFSYVNSLQKNYVEANVNTILNVVTIVVQIAVIVLFRDFLAYLITQSVMLLISRFVLVLFLNKKFPILKKKPASTLTKEEKKPIFKEVRGLIVHQFSAVAVHSTDNIIISSLTGLGVVAVGLISNYNLLINSVLGFVTIIFTSITSGFGNLAASGSVDDFRSIFKIANFINFWIYGFCSIAFFVLIPPFITLWIGKENLIDTISFLLIIINCYLQGQSTIYNNARIAKGNFNKDKWLALTQALVNLIVSIIGAKFLGLVGVYIGTVVSRLVYVVFRPLSTYKFLFGKSSSEYYLKLILYFTIVCISGGITYLTTYYLLSSVNILKFILSTFIVAIIPNLIFTLIFFRSKEFKEFLVRVKSFMKGKRKNG